MFALADTGKRGEEAGLSSTHFIAWAQSHVIGSAILESVEKVRADESRGANGDMDAKQYASQFAAAVVTRERCVYKQPLPVAACLCSQIESCATSEKKLKGRQLMGSLLDTTSFDVGELRLLRRKFEERTGSSKHEESGVWHRYSPALPATSHTAHATDVQMSDQLTKSEFCEVIVECYPHLEGATDVNLEALFDTFDEDGGGTIDFKEFTLGVSKLTRGSMDEKMEFLFEIYDRNGTWLSVGLVVAVELVADAGTLCDGIVQVMAPSMLPS